MINLHVGQTGSAEVLAGRMRPRESGSGQPRGSVTPSVAEAAPEGPVFMVAGVATSLA
jgi:hypothetical protein